MDFFGECKLNQLCIQDDLYLCPFGVDVYKPDHPTVTTQSMSYLLMVDSDSKVVYSELHNNKADGTTDYKRILSFFANALKCLPKLEFGSKDLVYLDKCGAHVKAFNNKKDVHGPQVNLVRGAFQTIPAPSCTPESNLAEFFFRSLKLFVAKKLFTCN